MPVLLSHLALVDLARFPAGISARRALILPVATDVDFLRDPALFYCCRKCRRHKRFT